MSDKAAQDDELQAIRSIYEEEDIFSFDETTRTGSFYAKQECTTPDGFFTIHFTSNQIIKVKHLMPVRLEFQLPEDYPSKSKPSFELTCSWLTRQQLDKLDDKLNELWTECENSCILFTWISFLANETLAYLSIDPANFVIETEPTDTPATATPRKLSHPNQLSALFVMYDQDQLELEFMSQYFLCEVCYMEKPGKDCIRFNKCQHVFCIECIRTYFENQIREGNVKSMFCAASNCESQAIPTQVLKVVGPELFDRYDSLLLKDSLNNMPDIIYCPRINCQCAVIPEDNLASCPDCKYNFCSLCKQGYHGIEPCKISDKELKRVVESYMNGDEATRVKLGKKYGEKRLDRAVEEYQSMILIENTSKQCPECKSWMQKLDGCNKMTCRKCLCYFCWMCMQALSKTDPYGHYSDSKSGCFEKLFQEMPGLDQDEDEEDDDDDAESD